MNLKHGFIIICTSVFLLGGCGTAGEQVVVQPSPTPYPQPNITVCASGCNFKSIQEAIDSEGTQAGTIIGLRDAIHTEGGIHVNKSVIIQGKGAQETVVQAHANPGEGTQRVFEVPPDNAVTIRGMTIRHGSPKTQPLVGGGILNYGTLIIEDAVLRDNFGSAGGGLYNEGTTTLINSAISHNGSIGGGEAYLECSTGGGIKVISGTVTLINSAINDNQANGKGGGAHVACSGRLELQNSTVSGNYTNDSGGGIYLNGSGEFVNSTISNNSAKNVGGINIEGSGEINQTRGQLSLTNTLIANNIGRLEKYGIADCYANIHAILTVNSFNWIGDGNCNPAFSSDPLMGPLADNGGSTPTHALLPGSPAIDAIPQENCALPTDQRGTARTAPCDIGAFEAQTSDNPPE
jgi:hypothetical protein